MFAVIKAGGRQYRVAAADVISIDRVTSDVGDAIDFDQVLMLGGPEGVTLGSPVVDGASVAGEVIEHKRGDKIIVFKKRRRKNSRRSRGHRQHMTLVRITDILAAGKKASPRKAAANPKPAAKNAEATAEPKVRAAKAPSKPAAAATSFARPSAEPNDLKKITGVGPVLEGKLNAIGITRLDQIAAFSAEDVAKVDELLNFKGRIDRDDWITQANNLAAGAKSGDAQETDHGT